MRRSPPRTLWRATLATPPALPGALCVNCHMPNTVYGLLKATRSHRITSPDVRTDLEHGRPNACNLCHLDKPLAWTAQRLAEDWNVAAPDLPDERGAVAEAPFRLLTGDAGQRALWAWHMGWKPALEASGDAWQAPFLAATLDDPYAVVRGIAVRSLREAPGYGSFQFDFAASAAQRSGASERARRVWSQTETPSAVPFDSIELLLRRRDDRPMRLAE